MAKTNIKNNTLRYSCSQVAHIRIFEGDNHCFQPHKILFYLYPKDFLINF